MDSGFSHSYQPRPSYHRSEPRSSVLCNDDVSDVDEIAAASVDASTVEAQSGYWSKGTSAEVCDRMSPTSCDTGFDPDNSLSSNEDNDVDADETSVDNQKRVFCKTTSNDSGVAEVLVL